MDRHLARHFAVLAETNDDSWSSASPSHALSELEVGEAALLDHLAAVERMLLRPRQQPLWKTGVERATGKGLAEGPLAASGSTASCCEKGSFFTAKAVLTSRSAPRRASRGLPLHLPPTL